MEIKKVKDKENKFILNNQRVILKPKISEKFYQLINEQKYDDAFDLVNDSNQVNNDTFRKAIYILGIGSVLGAGVLYLSSITGINMLSTFGFITFGTTGGLFLKEVANIVKTFNESQKVLKIIAKETEYNENKEFDVIKTESLEMEKTRVINQTNSFKFDKEKFIDSNIVDFDEYKNKHR